jgi:hypothetical protein
MYTPKLNDEEKQILVDLVRTTVQKLRAYPSGFRFICADADVIKYILENHKECYSFFPFYLPHDLTQLVSNHRTEAQDRVFRVEGDAATLLDRLWHILAYHSDPKIGIRGCFQVQSTEAQHSPDAGYTKLSSKKLNILIGRPTNSEKDTSFNNVFNTLAKRKEEAINLTMAFVPGEDSSTGLIEKTSKFFMRYEAKRRDSVLRYFESALLKYYRPDGEGNFSNSLPPNNLRKREAWYQWDVPYIENENLARALEHMEMRGQVYELIKRLNQRRVIIVGGFGSGSDRLSWMALREIAVKAQNDGLFRILQFAGTTDTGQALRDLISDDLHGRGTGFILRDLLDPVTAYWSKEKDDYAKSNGFLRTSGAAVLLQDFLLKEFLLSVRNDSKYAHTRIIITSQYDSLDALKFAVKERLYAKEFALNKERREKAALILEDFKEEDFWNPAGTMERSIMEETTKEVFKAWLRGDHHRVPSWVGQALQQSQGQAQASQLVFRPPQMPHLTRHSYMAHMYRIAAWCRIWLRLLDNSTNIEDFNEVDKIAEEYKMKVEAMHKQLHDRGQMGIDFQSLY